MKNSVFARIMVTAEVTGLAIMAGVSHVNAATLNYSDMIKDSSAVTIVECDKLTADMLEHRNGRIIIEKIVGVVTSATGDGRILNTADDEYNYISYSSVKGADLGNVFVTYCVYNPENNAIDDVIARVDYEVDSNTFTA